MSDNTTQPVEKKTVADFSDSDIFFIPSYQRGYRWGEVQVRQLAEDLLEAAKAEEPKPYCLQPLVVRRGTEGWRVIDGQQRLTTLWLLLYVLNDETPPEWQLLYERHGNGQELLDIPKSKPDGFFIDRAIKTLNETIKDDKKARLLKYLNSDNGPFFLWYEVPKGADEHEEHKVFARLNSGKIPLSNAELIKAELLSAITSKRDRYANALDRMEQRLRDEDFWCFVNPEPKATRFSAARIDFLFELWYRGQPKTSTKEDLEKDPFAIYEKARKQISEDRESFWEAITAIFNRLDMWYVDQRLYHLLGFLMCQRKENPEVRFQRLVTLLEVAKKEPRSEFDRQVSAECRTLLLGDKKSFDEMALPRYDGDWKARKQIEAILLAFNLAMTEHAGLERTRFPFGTYRNTKWTLEHIHAQQEEGSKELKQDGDIDLHAFGNMALLPHETNARFNNATFPAKREWLRKWADPTKKKDSAFIADDLEALVQADPTKKKDSAFIPFGTRMVFCRLVGKESGDTWDTDDQKLYTQFVIDTLKNYLKETK